MWRNKRFRRAMYGVGLVALGATVTAILWPTAKVQTKTPTLTQLKQKSDAYLTRHAQGFISTSQYPASATTAWHARMSDFSGNLQMEKLTKSGATWSSDSWHALTKNGTPQYQLRSPIPVKGQGRKGWNFTRASSEDVRASSTSTLEIGSNTSWTVETLITPRTFANYDAIIGSSRSAGTAGWGMEFAATGQVQCLLSDGTNMIYATLAGVLSANKTERVTCTWASSGGTWSAPEIYVAGVKPAQTTGGTAPSGSIANGQVVRIGQGMGGAGYLDSAVHEIRVSKTAMTPTQILANYRQTLKDGTYWADDSNTVAHYRFDETTTKDGLRDSSGNGNHLTTVVGTPDVQYGNPPYPMGSGFARRGIGTTDGDTHYFAAASTTTGDQATNDFSLSFWFMLFQPPGVNGSMLLSKWKTATNTGYSVRVNSAYIVGVQIGDGTSLYNACTTAGQDVKLNTWNLLTVNFDRDGDASCHLNNEAGGAPFSIAARSGSVSNDQALLLFRATGTTVPMYGSLGEVTIHNGLTTAAEHQAIYRAFKKPAVGDPGVVSPITYAQTSSGWKWPLPPEDGFGVRSSNVAGSSSNPQWPVAYSEKRISTANPLGLEFPTSETVTNVIGYPNQIDQWTPTGATLQANVAEAPDGSFTADRITFSANGQTIYKGVVGGGSILAGERWCASASVKRNSGTCSGIQFYCSGVIYSTLVDSPTWAKVSCCSTSTTGVKQITFYAATHGSCVLDVADAQYTQNQVYPDCTNCTGNSNCVCNPSWQKQDWSAYATYMPTALERGEVTVEWSGSPGVHAADAKQVIWQLGDFATMYAGMQPAFVLRNQGGGVEAVACAKPLQVLEEGRTYTASWDLRDGLTNTGPSNWGWDFPNSTDYVYASSNSVNSITGNEFTLEACGVQDTMFSFKSIAGSSQGTPAGYGFLTSATGGAFCKLSDGITTRYAQSPDGSVAIGVPYCLACVGRKVSGAWEPDIYVSGILATIAKVGGPVTGSIANAIPFTVGTGSGGYPLDGRAYEVRVSNKALSDAEIKASYERSRYQGLTWQDDSSTVAHYTFSESSTSSGLRDSTANGNHLTVVTGSPTAQYDKLPWPDDQRQYAGLRTEGRERTNWGWDFVRADSEYVRAPNATVNSGLGNAFTLSTELSMDDLTNYQVITGNFSASSRTHSYGFLHSTSWPGSLACYVDDGTNYSYARGSALTAGGRYSATCVFRKPASTWQVDLYVNGAVDNAGTASNATGAVTGDNPWTVGAAGAGTAYAMDGRVFQTQLINRALSAAEVYERYNKRTLKGLNWEKDPDELAHYLMDETSRSQGLKDTSGNNNHLTVINGTPEPHFDTLPYENTEQTYAYYQPAAMAARTVTSTTNPVEAPSQRDLNAYVISIGCDHNGQNCSNGGVADITFTSRPAQKIVGSEVDLAYMADMTGPAWVSRAPAVDLCDFDFGVSSSNRWCWNMAEYGGKIRDQVNGVELTATGTPVHQVNSGLLARGQGRRGVNGSNTKYVSASSNAVLNIGNKTSWTLSAVMSPSTVDNSYAGLGSSCTAATMGYGLFTYTLSGFSAYICVINDGTNQRSCRTAYNISPNSIHDVECSYVRTGGTWDCSLALDGVDYVGTIKAGTQPTVDINNAAPFTIGKCGAGSATSPHVVYEVDVADKVFSPVETLARYNRLVQSGRYRENDSNTVAHFKMNETAITNGIGLKDHSGNGNHLTVVTGTPDPAYRDMPWPAGSGVVKPVIDYTTTGTATYHAASSATVASPSHQQPFSIATLMRVQASPANQMWFASKNYSNTPSYMLYYSISGSVFANLRWRVSDGDTDSFTGALAPGLFHLIAGKIIWDGDSWQSCISADGGAFSCTDNNKTGDPSSNPGMLKLGQAQAAASSGQAAGTAIWKNYALTDANVAQLWDTIKGPLQADHTYARTSTGPKGVCYDVANDPIDGMRVRCFGDNSVPYAYSSSLTGLPGNERLGLGMPVSATVTNVNVNSEAFNTWTTSNATAATDYTFGPDGTKTAESLTEDDTAGVQHYITHGMTIASTGDCVTMLYAKKGSRWGIRAVGQNGTHYAYLNLGSCSVGATGGGGGAENSTATGVGNGWCKLTMPYNNCTSGAATVTINLASADGTVTFDGNSTTYANGAYLGAMAVYSASTAVAYCPTNASTQTCNAPTSNYVGQSLLAGWSREEGILLGVADHSAASVLLNLQPAAGSNNSMYVGSGGGFMIRDNSGTQQQVSNIPLALPLAGEILMYDSQEAWYQTTRRSVNWQYGPTSLYPGPNTSWLTDLGANWTYGGGTSLWLGQLSVGTFKVDHLGNVYIYNRR